MADVKGKRLAGQALKEANSAISKLRKAGLYHGKKAIGQPTAYALRQVKKFSDVITGLAKAVTVTRETKKAYGDKFRTKGNKLVVPVKKENSEIVRVVKSKVKGAADELRVYGESVSGARYSRSIKSRKKGIGPDKPHRDFMRKQEGPGVLFLVPMARRKGRRRWTSYSRFDRYDDALHMIQEYVRRSAAKSASQSEIEVRIVEWEAEIEIERTK